MTSEEHLERLNGRIPPSDQPLPPPLQTGDPGPFTAERRDSVDTHLAVLTDMAKSSVNYQCAVLALLSGYAEMSRRVGQALSYLKKDDMEPVRGLRDELKEALGEAERALRGQQPEAQREAAE